jgi:hypothetical protein
MRIVLAGLMLLFAAAPAAEPMSSKGTCKSRCQVQYQLCLKRTTTQKGRALCKAERKTCKGSCR